MNKFISLLKANMSEGMNIFKINTKKQTKFSKIILPIILAIIIMFAIYSYAEQIITKLQPINMEFVTLTLFIIITSIITIVEGIYKSGNLLFQCKDDNLLLSLPIKKSIVLAIRVLKFYLFELLYNSVFLIPAILCYAMHTNPKATFYLVSIIGLLLFPIIPILISCIIGTIITFFSSKFKGKNIAQTIITFIFLLGVMYASFNLEKIIINIANNAANINDFITKIYYPAGAYQELITSFNILTLLKFIIINLGLLAVTIALIGRIYFNINSKVKAIKTRKSDKNYIIKTTGPIRSLIKKEFNRFIGSTVFFTNAGLGVLLHIVACIVIAIKFEIIGNTLLQIEFTKSLQEAEVYVPLILFALVCLSSCMTSITSSMISLEGKAFNILKTIPIKPYKIIKAKIISALLIMIPCILIGDIIVFIRFRLDIISMLLILISSVLFPLLTQTIGILVNLKYPRMDAKNDTEVVKQSMSSAISVFLGFGLFGITAFVIFKAIMTNVSNNLIMIGVISVYAVLHTIVSVILHKTAEDRFNDIDV